VTLAQPRTRPRLGFAGIGWIGRNRLEAIERSGAADVAGVCDPAHVGCLGSFDELLALDLDGVVIASPSALHATQAIAALERSLAVFCQKPLALDGAQARQVVDAARAADRLLMVDLSYRWTEAARCVRDEVAGGGLGEVYAAELAFHNAYGPDKAWFYDRELSGGGCVIDLGVHLIDLALWTLGFPRVISVASHLHGDGVEDYASSELELEGGAVVRLACSWGLHAGRDCVLEASFYGTRGGAAFRNVGGSFYDFVAERYEGTQTRVLTEPPDAWSGRGAVEWARRVAAGERFDAAAGEHVTVHDVIDRIYGAPR
jgi:predicted dehydrogenase